MSQQHSIVPTGIERDNIKTEMKEAEKTYRAIMRDAQRGLPYDHDELIECVKTYTTHRSSLGLPPKEINLDWRSQY